MNIHEYQAKNLLREYGVPVSNGVVIFSLDEINEKIKQLNSKKLVVKAQIHAGGRGKAGGVKVVNNSDEAKKELTKMFGKILITHQTGPKGKKVNKVYVEEASEIQRELYLSCLVDRASSKIAFIRSSEGGMDIEKVASENQIRFTTKVDLKDQLDKAEVVKI